MIDAADTVALVARLAGLAILVDALELLALRPLYGPAGVWRWTTLAGELPRWTHRLLDDRGFPWVVRVRAVGALLLLALGASPVVLVLVPASLLVSARWRGSVNGGSDAMAMVLLLGLVPAGLASLPGAATHAVIARELGLGYIAVQVTLSYLIGGLTKIKERTWRSGQALPALLALPAYGAPAALVARLAPPGAARLASAGVLAFECGFPLAFAGPLPGAVLLGTGLLFHAVNARVLGLNRFLLAWGAAYPAVWYFAQRGPPWS